MANIEDFLLLMAEAKAKKEEEAKLKEQEEKQLLEKKVAEAAPFLSDLFNVVVDSKKKIEEKKEADRETAAPILKKFEEALRNPEQFKQPDPEEVKKQVVEIVEQLEDKAAELERKLESSKLQKQINAVEKQELSELEKKFLSMFKTLQSDFTTLKKYVNAIPRTQMPYGGGFTAGSGEVRLRNLDDVDKTTIQDNYFLKFDAAAKKFVFAPVNNGGGGNSHQPPKIVEIQLSGFTSTVTHHIHKLDHYYSYRVINNLTRKEVFVDVAVTHLTFVVESLVELSRYSLIIVGH